LKKIKIHLHFSLVIAILFSIFFQSLDSYAHFEKEKTETICLHNSASKHEITHQHHSLEHCFVCEFVFSSGVSSNPFEFKSPKNVVKTTGSFYYSDFVNTHIPNSNLLRGPPVFNV